MAGVTTYSVWDGWNLVEEYRNNPSFAVQARYLYGPTGPIKNLVSNNYYYQDGSGSTSHLADGTGHLLEWYRYDLQGTPVFYDASNNQLSASNYSVRHLLTGQQWYSELGLYDLRNRFYSPDIGRFLQPDPSGFDGDATNLYRYCGNNPVTRSDPSGQLVLLAIKQVAGVGAHPWFELIPDNPALFYDNPAFYDKSNVFTGVATVSGQPSGNWRDWGFLTSTLNSDLASSPVTVIAIEPQPGQTDAQLIQGILDSQAAFPNSTYEYYPVPEWTGSNTYNSNSYAAWVLDYNGYPGSQILHSQGWRAKPGFDRVPPLGKLDQEPTFQDIHLRLDLFRPTDLTFGFPGFSGSVEGGSSPFGSGVPAGNVFYGPGPATVTAPDGTDIQVKLF
jgi:RHS repeat-associated protein